MDNHELGYIYALRCPLSHTIRYIGQTRNSTFARFKEHMRNASSPNRVGCHALYGWLADLLAQGHIPSLETLCTVPMTEISRMEAEFISKYSGNDLLNRLSPSLLGTARLVDHELLLRLVADNQIGYRVLVSESGISQSAISSYLNGKRGAISEQRAMVLKQVIEKHVAQLS